MPKSCHYYDSHVIADSLVKCLSLIVSLLERFCSVAVHTSVKMKGLSLACLLLALVPQLVLGTHDVYIVTMVGDPVVSYTGGVEGFPATAADLDEEMDVTRYCTLLDIFGHVS